MIKVEVAFALPERQEIIELMVEEGCTAFEAVTLSKIKTHFPEIDLEVIEMGIFSKHLDGKVLPLPKAYILQDSDRVEIYRPLLIDPKQSRILRAQKSREKKLAEEG